MLGVGATGWDVTVLKPRSTTEKLPHEPEQSPKTVGDVFDAMEGDFLCGVGGWCSLLAAQFKFKTRSTKAAKNDNGFQGESRF